MLDTCQSRLIALQKTSSPDYLRIVFNAWRNRAVIVPTDSPATLVVPGMFIAERLVAAPGGGWFDETLDLDNDPGPAQISFTSGTTGTPKPILLSRRALSDVSQRLNTAMQIDASIREYVGVPVTFSFGLGRARAIAAAGGRSFLPATGFRPDEFAHMLARGEVNALSAVPTLLRILVQHRDLFAECGAKLRWMEIGSQYMSAEEKVAVRAIFPNARIVQHYGLTEASRSTFLVVSEAEGFALESVGQPASPDALRIQADGRIAVRGCHVADGIVTEGGLLALTDGDGWLVTNDLGALDATGHVHFKGRADHQLNVSGVKVPAELFEQRLMGVLSDDALQIAVAARIDPLRGEAVMIAYLAGVDVTALRDKARQVGAGFGLSATDLTLVEVPEIPRTDTGKVRRGLLTELYSDLSPPAAAASTADLDEAPMSPRERELAEIWREALGVSRIGRNETFFELGGDSLSAISTMLRMERVGMSREIAQAMLEGYSIAQIASLAPGQKVEGGPQAQTSDAINMTRGLLVLVVIAAHWGPFLIARTGHMAPVLFGLTSPLFRLGTVGFAMVFGIGLSFFYLPTLRRSSDRLGAKLRTNAIVVGAGVAILAIIKLANALLIHADLAEQWPTMMFYEVLLFYLLMILSAAPLLHLVARMRFQAVDSLLCAMLLFGVSAAMRAAFGDMHLVGFAELGRLMLVAKYAYPTMLSYVLIGIAIGYWIEHGMARADFRPQLVRTGATLLLAGLVLSASLGTLAAWMQSTANSLMVISYAGTIMLLFAAMAKWRADARSHLRVKAGRLLLLIGLLAFPAFVAHEGVLGIKEILSSLNVTYVVAISLPLGLFAIGAVLAIGRLHRLYYGRADAPRSRPVRSLKEA